MPDPTPIEEPSPTLQPIAEPAAPEPPPAVPPPAGPPPGGPALPPQQPRPAYRPPRKSGGVWKVLLLVLLLLALVGSVVLNLVLLAGLAAGFDMPTGSMQTTALESGSADEQIAVYGVGSVLDSRAVAQFRSFYKAVAGNPNVQAVVLRVSSPGGGVTASDQICEMVKSLKARGKKVVVSMGSVAASGGYYISAPADEIYAEPTTVTGSIGVIAWWVALGGTLDKIGAEPVVVKSSHAEPWKDAWGGFETPHDYQRKHIQDVLDQMQKRFEQVVSAGRGNRLSPRSNEVTIPARDEGEPGRTVTETEPFNGKIYLADDAVDLGLVDKIGYQKDALDAAARLAGLTDRKVVRYSRRASLMEQLLQSRSEPSLTLDADLLDKVQTPRFMMIWKAE